MVDPGQLWGVPMELSTGTPPVQLTLRFLEHALADHPEDDRNSDCSQARRPVGGDFRDYRSDVCHNMSFAVGPGS